jgi:hypothetical protein
MSRAPVRFRARYIRVRPRIGNEPCEMHLMVTGLDPETVDAEILQGQTIAHFIEVMLNSAFVAFAKPRKVQKT